MIAVQEKPATQPARRPKRVKPETSIVFATVEQVERYRPHIQRVTLASPEFPGFITEVPDQFITFIFPTGDRKVPAVGRDFDWDRWFETEEASRPHARNYTVRHWRPETNQVVVDMMLHGDEGRGSVWAEEAEPGDALIIWGPRMAYDPPPNATWQLLIGDDTGLPEIAAILEHMPDSTRARVIAEVGSLQDQYPLASDAEIEVTWLYRGARPPGRSDALIDAVRAVELPPDEVRYAWGGGEFRTMQAIGRYLRRECGFRPSDVAMIGYW